MLHISISHDTSIRLEGCPGERYQDGEFIPCGSGCVAHFDANHETMYGEVYSPYPNSILSWVALLPGSSAANELIPVDAATGARPEWITIHRHEGVFLDSDGDPVPVWVVNVDAATPDSHFAALFRSRAKAAGMAAELIVGEENR